MLILTNAHIHTLNPRQPEADCIAIGSGRVLAVGSRKDMEPLANARTTWQDMQGQTIIPGLTDAHIHLQTYALNLQKIDCETDTLQECLQRVAERANKTDPESWILGHGWNQNLWEGGFGTTRDLETVAPGRAVYLTAKSLHASWASQAALQAAGISESTQDPPGGIIQRDEQGMPTGILFESAMGLVERAIPKPGDHEVEDAIASAQFDLMKMGITSVHDFDRIQCFQALQSLAQAGKLHLRVVKGIPYENLADAIQLGLQTGFGSTLLRMGSLKLFADGALGPQTAAMLEPYGNNPSNSGILLLDENQIVEIGIQAVKNGISLAVHAIGDRANRTVLNGYAKIRAFEKTHQIPHLRHRIEHVQLLNTQDLQRLSDLDILASVQPIHAPSDMITADHYWGERARLAYPFHSLLESGARLVFGSDAPVESPNPFLGLHAAVTRQRISGDPGPMGWNPEQRISLLDALHGFTTGPAFAAGLESQAGILAEGFLADLIVLPTDPFQVPASELWTLTPSATMIGGQWFWTK